MRRILGVVLLLGCAAQPRAGRPAGQPYKDAPAALAIAAGTSTAAAVGAAAVVTTVAVGTVVVGAEQFPDPPAGTPPTPIDTAPRDPNRCRSCRCFGLGKSPDPRPPRKVPDGSGYVDHTRATCRQVCTDLGYSGFDCSGDKKVTWYR